MTDQPTDKELLAALLTEDDPVEFAQQLYAFYHDIDRANRTSREYMYLHLGLATGMILKLSGSV
jgi:hypothetical protein